MSEDPRGLRHGFTAYVMWGLFPLYFRLLDQASAFEVVSYRITFSLVFSVLVATVARMWGQIRTILKDRRTTVILLIAGVLVSMNWTLYVWGVNNDHAIDASLGYFINPLVSAALGVLVLKERMRKLQWAAFGVAAVAIVVLIVGYGAVPWVAFGLALSFGLYGLVKKQVGGNVPPVPGLAIETTGIAIPATAFLIYLNSTGQASIDIISGTGVLAMMAGPVTAIPLIFFASATARVKLSTMGTLQFINPLMQFLIGWLVFGEDMPPARWIGFIIIWVAVAMFLVDAFHQGRRPSTARTE